VFSLRLVNFARGGPFHGAGDLSEGEISRKIFLGNFLQRNISEAMFRGGGLTPPKTYNFKGAIKILVKLFQMDLICKKNWISG